jgi:hypothetical protein
MPEPAVIPGWRKSSYSGNGGTSCVEAAHVPARSWSATPSSMATAPFSG